MSLPETNIWKELSSGILIYDLGICDSRGSDSRAIETDAWEGAVGGVWGVAVESCPVLSWRPHQQPWRTAQDTAVLRMVVY